MSVDKALRDLFQTTCSEIESKITENVKAEVKNAEEDFFSKNGMNAIDTKIRKIDDAIKKLENEKTKLQEQREKVNSKTILSHETDHEKLEAMKQVPGIGASYYGYGRVSVQKSNLHAYNLVKNSIALHNYIARKEIRKGFEYTFRLVASNKEARNIILQLQAYNWKSLGIDIPPQFINAANINIQNGIIQMQGLPAPKQTKKK